MEAELGAMSPPASDHLKSSEAGQGQVEHLDPPQGNVVCRHLDFPAPLPATLRCQVCAYVE